jgi:hypothetical protein
VVGVIFAIQFLGLLLVAAGLVCLIYPRPYAGWLARRNRERTITPWHRGRARVAGTWFLVLGAFAAFIVPAFVLATLFT